MNYLIELSHALKRLARAPGYSLTGVAVLAIGIGTSTAIFALVHGTLIRPLPYPDQDRLVSIAHSSTRIELPQRGVSDGLLLYYAQNATAMEQVAGYTESLSVVGDSSASPEQVSIATVTPSLFSILRTRPFLGRLLTVDDVELDTKSGTFVRNAVVVGYDFWRRRLGGDRAVLGRVLYVDREAHTIVGVLEPGFGFPRRDTAVWVCRPSEKTPGNDRAALKGLFLISIARLRPGASPEAAQSELTRLLAGTPDRFPDVTREQLAELDLLPSVVPLKSVMVAGSRPTLLWLLATAAAVLLAAWANVIGLVLVKSGACAHELSVMRALGASRSHLVRRLALDAMLLALLGGVAAVPIAVAGATVRLGFGAGVLARADEVWFGASEIGLMVVLTAVSAGLIALVGLVRSRATDADVTPLSGRGVTSRREERSRRAVVAVQLALALPLLVCTQLMASTVRNLNQVELGFDSSNRYTFRVAVPTSVYSDYHKTARVHSEIRDQLRGIAGVEQVEAVSVQAFPLVRDGATQTVRVFATGADNGSAVKEAIATFGFATPDYFQAMAIPVEQGRTFQPSDMSSAGSGAIVSHRLANSLFGNPSRALGQRVRIGRSTNEFTIIGVVGDVRGHILKDPTAMTVYLPNVYPPQADRVTGAITDYVPHTLVYVATTRQPEASLLPLVRETVSRVDAQLVVTHGRWMGHVVQDAKTQDYLLMLQATAAAGVAMFLAIVGLYSVVAMTVARRMPEFGVRAAFGATSGHIARLVFVETGKVVAVGVVIGLIVAYWLTGTLSGLVYGVETRTIGSFLYPSLVLVVLALAANTWPALRAGSADPAVMLRTS